MKSKILITGSSGFIGKILANKLKKNYDVYLIDKKRISTVQKKFYQINLLEISDLKDFFSKNKIDLIIHLASEIFDDDDNVYNHNIQTSKNLISLAKKFNVKNFIFTSTFSIYEKNYNKPIKENEPPSASNSYGKSKYQIERMLLKSKLKNFTILRVPIVVGKSRSHRMGILFELIRNSLPIILINNGKNKIQYIAVDDLVKIIKKCINLNKRNLFNVGSKISYTFKENLEFLIKKSGSKSKIYSVNYFFGSLLINILIFFRLIDINFYHKALLTKNIMLNTDKINKKISLKLKNSSKDILLESYIFYKKNFNKIKLIKSGSDKRPSLKILNLLKFFSFLFR